MCVCVCVLRLSRVFVVCVNYCILVRVAVYSEMVICMMMDTDTHKMHCGTWHLPLVQAPTSRRGSIASCRCSPCILLSPSRHDTYIQENQRSPGGPFLFHGRAGRSPCARASFEVTDTSLNRVPAVEGDCLTACFRCVTVYVPTEPVCGYPVIGCFCIFPPSSTANAMPGA